MAAYTVTYSTTQKKENLSFMGKAFAQTWQHQLGGWTIKEPKSLSEQVSHYFNVPLELLEDIRHLSGSHNDLEIQEILTELKDYESAVEVKENVRNAKSFLDSC